MASSHARLTCHPLQTHGNLVAGLSWSGQAAMFWRVGLTMVRLRGLGALFVGIVPRLIQQVPSSTICWWSVEQTQKALAPYLAQGA